MATDNPVLNIGFVEDYRNEPAILIIGDEGGLLLLASLIESQWAGSLAALSPRVRLMNIRLDLNYSDSSSGLVCSGTECHWILSGTEVRVFPEQLRALVASESPGHAYLDT